MLILPGDFAREIIQSSWWSLKWKHAHLIQNGTLSEFKLHGFGVYHLVKHPNALFGGFMGLPLNHPV